MAARIAVLGAGPMGLAVAYQLARDGHCPVVYEADDRLGGMSAAFDFCGLRIERYYHFHCTSDTAFLGMLSELGLADRLHWVTTRMAYWYQNRLQAWGNPLALLRFRGLSPLAKFRYGLHVYSASKRDAWQALDRVHAIPWLKKWVGEEAYEVLWRRLFEYKFYQYSQDVSAAWIWSRIRRIGRSRRSLFAEQLGYLDGGSETLLQAMRRDIEQHGGEIRLSSPVSRVVLDADGVRGVESQGQFFAFEKVISTIPLPHVPALIPDLPAAVLTQLRALKNMAVVCVIVKLRRAVSDNFWLNTNDEEMDIPGLVEYSNLRPLDGHVVYVPFYMPSEHEKFAQPDQVFLDKVRRYLKKINPALVDEDFLALRASRYRYAQPLCEPGYLQRLPQLSVPGLWLADTSCYYPEDRGISESIAFGRKLARTVFS